MEAKDQAPPRARRRSKANDKSQNSGTEISQDENGKTGCPVFPKKKYGHKVDDKPSIIKNGSLRIPLSPTDRMKELEAAQKEVIMLTEESNQLKKKILASEKGKTSDLSLVEATVKHLGGVKKKASTSALKEAAQEAIDLFNIQDEISFEIQNQKDELKRIKREIRKYENRVDILEFERELIKKPPDNLLEDKAGEFSSSLNSPVTGCVIGQFTSGSPLIPQTLVSDKAEEPKSNPRFLPSTYEAFEGVRKIFGIDDVDQRPLTDVGNGVKISVPLKSSLELREGKFVCGSLSHYGVMAIYSKSVECRLQLTDLVRDTQVEIAIENATHTGFYDESMLILTRGKHLRKCTVKDMFDCGNVSVLNDTGTVALDVCADVTLVNLTRVMIFRSISGTPYQYSVDTGGITRVNIDKSVWSFGYMTGIDVGVKSVICENDLPHNLYAMKADDSFTVISNYTPSNCVAYVVPSESTPHDLRKALKVHKDGNLYTDVESEPNIGKPIGNRRLRVIIRLYHNIFLIYDGISVGWCVAKIIVP